jgi:hypothetical protein
MQRQYKAIVCYRSTLMRSNLTIAVLAAPLSIETMHLSVVLHLDDADPWLRTKRGEGAIRQMR